MTPYVLIVTGPAAAGKTSAAAAYAKSCRNPTAHISLDDVRDWLKSGYYDPALGWTAEANTQYARARAICADAARLYHADGISTVIDDAVFPEWPEVSFARWEDDLGLPRVLLAVILPTFEAVATRNVDRLGHRRIKDEMLRIIYDGMALWSDTPVPIVDNSGLSVAETAARLHAAVRDALPPATAPRP